MFLSVWGTKLSSLQISLSSHWPFSAGMYYIDPNQGSPSDALLAYCSFSSTSKQTCVHPQDSQVSRRHQGKASGNCISGSMACPLTSHSRVVPPESQFDDLSVSSHFCSDDWDFCGDDLNLWHSNLEGKFFFFSNLNLILVVQFASIISTVSVPLSATRTTFL